MCGIAGIIREKGFKPDPLVLKKMTDAMRHRGPDEEGFFIDCEAGLGVRRLCIIDLKSGSQPQSSPDKRFTLVFNGEIYNYRELRPLLEQKGYVFSTHSDTEVILASYSLLGPRCLETLDGMFAFAIWDSREKMLFLARDRLGVKPLYYSLLDDGTFLFASEIKPLLSYPGFKSSLNPRALDNLFTFGFQLNPGTFFKNVTQVLPGHYLMISLEKMTSHLYWDLNFSVKTTQGIKEASLELKSCFEAAVAKRLVSDVPVAAYLSGGIDSSAVAGVYSSLKGGKVRTFSIGFPYMENDETKFSREVSDYFKTENTPFLCKPSEEDFEKLVWFLEEPMATLLNLPLFYLSKKVQNEGYKVVLSGDGSDELLGGYDYFKLMKLLQGRLPSPPSRKSLLSRLNPELKVPGDQEIYYQYLLEQYQRPNGFLKNVPYLYQNLTLKNRLFSEEFQEVLRNQDGFPLPFDPAQLKGLSPVDQMYYLEAKMRLLSLTLPLSDKMSMANSIENRSPFLDYRLAEFSATLPAHYKIFGFKEKFILKKAMKGFLPEDIIHRKKQPLSASADWFLKAMGTKVAEFLDEKTIRNKGYFNPSYIRSLREETTTGKRNHSALLLIVIFVHLWDNLFLS